MAAMSQSLLVTVHTRPVCATVASFTLKMLLQCLYGRTRSMHYCMRHRAQSKEISHAIHTGFSFTVFFFIGVFLEGITTPNCDYVQKISCLWSVISICLYQICKYHRAWIFLELSLFDVVQLCVYQYDSTLKYSLSRFTLLWVLIIN